MSTGDGWTVNSVGNNPGPSTNNPSPGPTPLKRLHTPNASNRGPFASASKKRHLESPKESEQSGFWKHFKIEAFPKQIPAPQKYEKWQDWMRKFRIITGEMGKISQVKRANMLFVTVGDEVQEIIGAKSMLPDDELEETVPVYDNLVTKLNDYFKSLADPSLNLMRFDSIKQGKDEGVHDYQIRIFRLAEICGMRDNEMLLKERFTKGLFDKELAETSYILNWSLEETALAAARKEAKRASEPQKELTNPLHDDGMKLVASVSSRSADRGSAGRRDGFRHEDNNYRSRGGWRRGPGQRTGNSRSGGVKEKPCPNCGIVKHNRGICPAKEKNCNSCGKIGHFRAVCRSSVSAVAASDQMKEESGDDKVKIFD